MSKNWFWSRSNMMICAGLSGVRGRVHVESDPWKKKIVRVFSAELNHARACKSQRSTLGIFLCSSPFYFFETGFLPWILIPNTHHSGVRAVSCQTQLLQGFQGSILRPSWLYNKHFTHWARSPGPKSYLFLSLKETGLRGPYVWLQCGTTATSLGPVGSQLQQWVWNLQEELSGL